MGQKPSVLDHIKREMELFERQHDPKFLVRLWRHAFFDQSQSQKLRPVEERNCIIMRILRYFAEHCLDTQERASTALRSGMHETSHSRIRGFQGRVSYIRNGYQSAIVELFQKIAKQCILAEDLSLYNSLLSMQKEQTSDEQFYVAALLLGQFQKYAAASPENAVRFWKPLLGSYEHALRAVSVVGDVDDELLRGTAKAFVVTMRDLASKPATHRYPEKRVLTVLIEHALNGSAEVDMTLLRILKFFFRNAPFNVLTHSKYQARHFMLKNGVEDAPPLRFNAHAPCLLLPDVLAEQVFEIERREMTRRQERSNEIRAFLNRFNDNHDSASQTCKRMCDEILTQYKMGLLPCGEDSMQIDMIALSAIGIKTVRFFPEGCTFPDVNIEIDVLKDECYYVTYKAAMRDFVLQDYNPMMFSNYYHLTDTLCAILLNLVIIDVMHRILVPAGRGKKKGRRTTSCVKNQGSLLYKTRPQFRRLADGTHSTPRAHGLMLGEAPTGWRMPSDSTYVSVHKRTVHVGPKKIDQPEEPFTYTDDSFFSSFQSE